MTRGRKIALIITGSLAGLIVAVVVAGIIIVQTQWFRNFVRGKIITSVEEGTGGTATIGAFSFDWTHLRADVSDFVIHGLEPKDAAPLFRAKLVEVELKLTSPLTGFIDIAKLLVDTPQANVIVFGNGQTNIPAPKIKKPSEKSGLETVVNLAIGKFDLRNGSLTFANRQTNFNVSGQNFIAHLDYNPANPSYTGEIDMSPLYLSADNNQTVNVNVKLPVKMEKDKISLANAQLVTGQSEIVVSASNEHMLAPRYSAHVDARVSLEEARRAAGLTTALDTRRGPSILNADLTASMDDNRIEIRNARVSLGKSNIEASGMLKDVNRPGALQFNSTLALGEIGKLLHASTQPQVTVHLGGNVGIAGNRVELSSFRLAALGGTITGSASLENMEQLRFGAELQNFDIIQVAQPFLSRPLGYDGVVSGQIH